MRARESTPAREKTTERGYFNWCIIIWPPCVERMGSRRRRERRSLQPLSNPSYEMLSLRSHWPRFCIIYSRCSAYGCARKNRTGQRATTPTSLLCHIFCSRREKNFSFSVAEPEQ